MKQKYSLMIADMQLSVVTDADPAEVERLVGILDRKMREINLLSRRCSKNEAALLCALEFCAERFGLQDENEELAERCAKYAEVLESFKSENASLKEELEHIKNENEVLRSLFSGNAAPAAAPTAENTVVEEVVVAEEIPSPTELLAEIAEDSDAKPEAAEVKEEPVQEKKSSANSRSRVGAMFDLLSFNDF